MLFCTLLQYAVTERGVNREPDRCSAPSATTCTTIALLAAFLPRPRLRGQTDKTLQVGNPFYQNVSRQILYKSDVRLEEEHQSDIP